MAENSKIAWTDGTFNPWVGCTRVSPGCENCYAENLMDRRYQKVKWGPGQPRVRTKTWGDPLRWQKLCESGVCWVCRGRKEIVHTMQGGDKVFEPCQNCSPGGPYWKGEPYRRKVFCASLADWLDDEVPHQWREDLFDLIEKCPSLDWLMLTKRAENLEKLVRPSWLIKPLKQVWYGVTAEDQKWWDKRIDFLRNMPAAAPRWVSYEPALGPINMGAFPGIDWLIIGGESSQMDPARPFDVRWASDLIEQCRATGVVPFVKQLGTNPQYEIQSRGFKGNIMAPHPVMKTLTLVDKAGADPEEWPIGIRVREFPK